MPKIRKSNHKITFMGPCIGGLFLFIFLTFFLALPTQASGASLPPNGVSFKSPIETHIYHVSQYTGPKKSVNKPRKTRKKEDPKIIEENTTIQVPANSNLPETVLPFSLPEIPAPGVISPKTSPQPEPPAERLAPIPQYLTQ